MEVSLLPTITRCWSRIGQQRIIPTPGVHAPKQWDWGAVDPVLGHTLHVVHPHRDNVGFRRLLALISRTYDLPAHPERRVILFVDNDKAHRAKAVHSLLDKHHRQICIEWLPPYSPELDPQEDVWQHLRRRVTHNFYFGHMEALLEAVDRFHQQLQTCPAQVRQLLGKWSKLISS
jgi:transposase